MKHPLEALTCVCISIRWCGLVTDIKYFDSWGKRNLAFWLELIIIRHPFPQGPPVYTTWTGFPRPRQSIPGYPMIEVQHRQRIASDHGYTRQSNAKVHVTRKFWGLYFPSLQIQVLTWLPASTILFLTIGQNPNIMNSSKSTYVHWQAQ